MAGTSSKKVLVVEDEKAYARALALKLEHEGFGVESAGDGQEAITLLTKASYDLVLLDLVMPRVNGFGVLEALQTQGVHVPVIILSNLAQAEDKKKAAAFGVTQFIEKSNTPIVDVIAMVKKALVQ
jgi:CheY-like chemotaxis protein